MPSARKNQRRRRGGGGGGGTHGGSGSRGGASRGGIGYAAEQHAISPSAWHDYTGERNDAADPLNPWQLTINPPVDLARLTATPRPAMTSACQQCASGGGGDAIETAPIYTTTVSATLTPTNDLKARGFSAALVNTLATTWTKKCPHGVDVPAFVVDTARSAFFELPFMPMFTQYNLVVYSFVDFAHTHTEELMTVIMQDFMRHGVPCSAVVISPCDNGATYTNTDVAHHPTDNTAAASA